MATVSFEEEQQLQQQPIASAGPKGITGFLIRNKLAKDQKSANAAMLVIIGICVVAAAAAFVFIGGDAGTVPTNAEKFRLEQSTPLPPR